MLWKALIDDYMKLNVDDPAELCRWVNSELDSIIGELTTESGDEQLNVFQHEAHTLLKELLGQLEALQANSEWETFTIAFYGETGSGKSTIIETLRVLLNEDSKLESQKAFREFQNKYELTADMAHILSMAEFYRNKMGSGELTASEGSVYLKILGILGVEDAVANNRNLGKITRILDGLELPFPEPR